MNKQDFETKSKHSANFVVLTTFLKVTFNLLDINKRCLIYFWPFLPLATKEAFTDSHGKGLSDLFRNSWVDL